jgi:hypothetical protein
VHGRQPDTDAKYAAEITQRFFLGGNTVEGSHRRQSLACGFDNTIRAMNRLIHPFLQCRVELLSFSRKDQHVAMGQPHMVGPGRRGDRRAKGTVGRSQRHARGRQDLSMPTPRHQHGRRTRSGQHCTHGAADCTGTNDHVSVLVSMRPCLFQCRAFPSVLRLALLSEITHPAVDASPARLRALLLAGVDDP